MKKQKTILVSPLDWGLGHATRVTPIINHLSNKGFRVILAADGRSYHYFQKEFPHLTLYRLPGIHVNYSIYMPLLLKMFLQIPKIFFGIYLENRRLKQLLKKEPIDLIISDNRYGLSNKHVPSVFISHQVNILVPDQIKFTGQLAHKFISVFTQKFTYYWIPDMPKEPSLSGVLSHPPSKSGSEYIGTLSRLQPVNTDEKLDFLVMLSGPEPQRTIFEQKILSNPIIKEKNAAVVRGVTENSDLPDNAEGVKILSHANAHELSRLICSAKFVICRSGYSTIMDLYHLQKPAVLVPTPGQTEQEYLAKHLSNGSFKLIKQKKFTLDKAVEYGEGLITPDKPENPDSFKHAVNKVIERHLK